MGACGAWAAPLSSNVGQGIEWAADRWVRVTMLAILIRANEFKFIQIRPNSVRSKQDLPDIKKIEIKYGFEGFEDRNNFLHRNFFIF
jgi:hypothetical protein